MPAIPSLVPGTSFLSFRITTMMHSVVVDNKDTLAASTKIALVTFRGLIISAFTFSMYSP